MFSYKSCLNHAFTATETLTKTRTVLQQQQQQKTFLDWEGWLKFRQTRTYQVWDPVFNSQHPYRQHLITLTEKSMFFLSWLTARGSGTGSVCLMTETDSPKQVMRQDGQLFEAYPILVTLTYTNTFPLFNHCQCGQLWWHTTIVPTNRKLKQDMDSCMLPCGFRGNLCEWQVPLIIKALLQPKTNFKTSLRN